MTTLLYAFIAPRLIPLNKNMKIAIPIVLAAVLLAGFYFLVFSKNFTKIKDLKEQERSLQADVKKAKGAADNLEQHEQELKEIKQQFEKISIVLPKAKEIPALLTGISDHGTSAGLDFNLFTPGNETSKDFYAEIPISIKVTGPYHNVGYFLDQVSKLERIVTVKNITLGGPKEAEGEMLLSSSCNLLTYRFLSEEERAQADQAQKKGKK